MDATHSAPNLFHCQLHHAFHSLLRSSQKLSNLTSVHGQILQGDVPVARGSMSRLRRGNHEFNPVLRMATVIPLSDAKAIRSLHSSLERDSLPLHPDRTISSLADLASTRPVMAHKSALFVYSAL